MSKQKVFPPFNPSEDAYRQFWAVLDGLAVNDAAAAAQDGAKPLPPRFLAERARDIVLAGCEVANETWEKSEEE